MTHTPPTPAAPAIYARISRDDAHDELGVTRQIKLCRDLAARLGWPEPEVFVDNDMSGSKRLVRPDYDRLLRLVSEGKIDGLLARSTDRFTRDPRELEDFIDAVGEDARGRRAVPIETVGDGKYDLRTTGGRTYARIVGALAKQKVEEMSRDLRAKHAELAEAGKPSGGPRPYGYEADHVTPHATEAPVVADVVRRVARGDSLSAIARDLNARGVPTAGGAKWSISQVKRLVTNPRYIGIRTRGVGDEMVEVTRAVWPPLVDEETWRRARALVTDPDRRRRREPRRYLLSGGLVRCHCGAAMIGRTHYARDRATTMTYQCRGVEYDPGRPGGCGVTSVRAARVEELIVPRAIELIEGDGLAKAMHARRAGGDAKRAATVEKLRAELARWNAMNDAGDLTPDEWLARTRSTKERLTAATAAMTAGTSDAAIAEYAGRPGALSAAWDGLTLDRQQAILRAVLDHVEIRGVGRTGRAFDPSRVVPHWKA